tara:strand:+ start:6923 stop:8539 length:1617 start_codon:yes stop_codon:yes gene_type:complete
MPRKPIDDAEMASIVIEAVNRLPGGFIIYGPDHEILLANEQNERDFAVTNRGLRNGLTYREAACESVKDVLPELDHAAAYAAADNIVSTLERGEAIELKTVHGTIMQVVELPLSFGGYVAVGADVTALRERERELKKMRKQADAASDAKSAFLANMSHEIRTPLNGILGMTQLLAAGNLTDEQRDQIETILDSGKTLMAILNDVLDLSKIEAGRFDVALIDNDLDHLLRRLSKLWEPRAAEKGLELELDIDPDMVSYLRFDPIRVRQCVSNLVSNAIKFTIHGKVTVHARVVELENNAYEARLTITDTGIGMDADTLERLFTPFTQADSSTSRQFGGTGLGLSISRKLAQLMGGDITVTSEEGKGSSFTLSFHAGAGRETDEPVTDADIDQTSSARWAKGMTALLVDDHPLNRKVARLFIEPLGISVVEAENGADALKMMEQQNFDLVLLDMHMPVMDGPEVLRHIRAERSPFANMPVIALTADSMGRENSFYDDIGADGYIPKPIDHRVLIMEIGRVLEKCHGRAPEPAKAFQIRRG